MDTTELIFILSAFMLWVCVYCPVIIYHLRKYHVRETNIVYILRYSNITIIQSILFIIKLIFGVFTMASSVHIFGQNTLEDDIVRAINAYLAAFFLYCFVWRFWLLRYNIMLNNIVINSEWKSIINPQKNEARNTFYAKYKRTFGETSFTMWIWLVFSIVLTTMFVLTHIVYPEFYSNSQDTDPYLRRLYASWDYIIPFVLLIIILKMTPDFEDNFHIRKEMKYIFICLCIQYAVYYTFLFIMYSVQLQAKGNELLVDVIFCIEFHLIIASQFVAMLISTFWVNIKCEDIIESHRYQIYHISPKLQLDLHQKHLIAIQPQDTQLTIKNAAAISIQTASRTRSYKTSDTLSDSTGDSYRDSLYDILSDGVAYHEFIKHLSKELSIECLLSLTEFVQFREHVTNEMIKDNENPCWSDSEPWIVELAHDIPQSFIVSYKESSNKEKAYLLYSKYIKTGAEHEINISAEHRGRYKSLFQNYDRFIQNDQITNRNLVCLFTPCCKEMIYLMIDARKRFQQTPIYYKLARLNHHK
eukprot:42748_1